MKPPIERRQKAKKRLPISTACSVKTGQNGQDATTFDISEGGMCFYSNKSVEIGKSVEVSCSDLWESPKRGIVRWCQKIHYRLYRVGVEFEKS